jgi:hypothetical protein
MMLPLIRVPKDSLSTPAAMCQRYPKAEPEWVAGVIGVAIARVGGRPSSQQLAFIAVLGIDDINERYISLVTDELEVIISHTAAVTNAILEACDGIDALTQEQRISKVMNALNTIEQKVLTTLARSGTRSRNPTNLTKPHGEGLLNALQLSESAMQQNGIDGLRASFD